MYGRHLPKLDGPGPDPDAVQPSTSMDDILHERAVFFHFSDFPQCKRRRYVGLIEQHC